MLRVKYFFLYDLTLFDGFNDNIVLVLWIAVANATVYQPPRPGITGNRDLEDQHLGWEKFREPI